MDSSFWTQLNPNIRFEPTRKQFFGKFCYKLVLELPGGRCINDTKNSISDAIAFRIANARAHNYGGSWRNNEINELQYADIGMLEEIKSIRNGYGKRIKVRVEEPWIQIYASSEDTLKDIALRFPRNNNHLITVVTPESAEHEEYLRNDCVILAKDNGYTYRVTMRDGNCGIDAKIGLLNYLTALGDQVKLGASVVRQLQEKYGYMWGCYFYTNDPSIITALNIIHPGITGKIHELKFVEQ